jgi:hypothetical protein
VNCTLVFELKLLSLEKHTASQLTEMRAVEFDEEENSFFCRIQHYQDPSLSGEMFEKEKN